MYDEPVAIGGNMAAQKLTAEQKKWQAEDDARVLAHAQEIADDKSRLKMAKGAAQKMASDAAKRAQTLVQVAKTPATKKAKPKAKKAAPKRAAAKRAPRRR